MPQLFLFTAKRFSQLVSLRELVRVTGLLFPPKKCVPGQDRGGAFLLAPIASRIRIHGALQMTKEFECYSRWCASDKLRATLHAWLFTAMRFSFEMVKEESKISLDPARHTGNGDVGRRVLQDEFRQKHCVDQKRIEVASAMLLWRRMRWLIPQRHWVILNVIPHPYLIKLAVFLSPFTGSDWLCTAIV